jgi:hypothetical protein
MASSQGKSAPSASFKLSHDEVGFGLDRLPPSHFSLPHSFSSENGR